MQFTERELTLGVQAAAKVAFASTKGRQAETEEWDSLTPYQRYQVLEPVSTQVLPVLLALPDVDVPSGTRPSFTRAQVVAAVEQSNEGEGGWLRRKAVTAGRVALVEVALDAMPPRYDPDSLPDDFEVPDHL